MNDPPGFIAPRRIAKPAVVDRTAQLTVGYPHGPLGFGEHFGAAHVESILHERHAPSAPYDNWNAARAL